MISEPGTVGHVVGCTVPRLWTRPLRELTPETSYGFAVIDFARDTLRLPLDPWEEWVVIHLGELLPDGRPRFRKLLLLVARQNGKTHLLVVLTLFWMFIEQVSMVLGTSTKLDYAQESWSKAYRLARRIPALACEIPRKGGIRKANGEQVFWRATKEEEEYEEGSRYKIAASNEEGGRSLTIDRLVLDELRQHHDYSAHDAAEPATSAVAHAQIVGLSNAGSLKSVVLNDWREEALHFIETGEGDYRVGLFEYSAPEGSDPRDIEALRMANPNLGIRKDPNDLLAAGHAAVRKGGLRLTGFMTEHMCITVRLLNPAISPEGWKAGALPGTMDKLRDKIATCFDVSPDNQHVTLLAAAVEPFDVEYPDGSIESRDRIRGEVIAVWEGPGAVRQFVSDLPGWMRRVKPRSLRWFPGGPAATVASDIKAAQAVAKDEHATAEQKRHAFPDDLVVEEIKGETTAVCMALAELVGSRVIVHSDDDLLNAHVGGAEKLHVGELWRFTRRGADHCDAAYALAGAVDGARNLPAQPAKVPRSAVY